jgi:hydrogenase small subunit
VEPEKLTAPAGVYPPIASERGTISPLATGVAGLLVGAAVGGGYMASKKLSEESEKKGGRS